jgi:hypothetical protein
MRAGGTLGFDLMGADAQKGSGHEGSRQVPQAGGARVSRLLDGGERRDQKVELIAPLIARRSATSRWERNMKSLLYSRVLLAVALLVALAVSSGAAWKWDW